jgi:hypothetical protein
VDAGEICQYATFESSSQIFSVGRSLPVHVDACCLKTCMTQVNVLACTASALSAQQPSSTHTCCRRWCECRLTSCCCCCCCHTPCLLQKQAGRCCQAPAVLRLQLERLQLPAACWAGWRKASHRTSSGYPLLADQPGFLWVSLRPTSRTKSCR